jgi:hypothetical protein
MNTTEVRTSPTLSGLNFKKKANLIMGSIPGMRELSNARDEKELHQLQLMYPDAAFARMIASSLFCPDRELGSIYLQAYRAIVEGEAIGSVRHRFEKNINTYWANHMWDD